MILHIVFPILLQYVSSASAVRREKALGGEECPDTPPPEFLCGGENWDTIMCPDGTPWAGESSVWMDREDSCGEPCPVQMDYATDSSTGQKPRARCRGKCFTCESAIFTQAAAAIGWKDGSELLRCEGRNYTMKVDGYELP